MKELVAYLRKRMEDLRSAREEVGSRYRDDGPYGSREATAAYSAVDARVEELHNLVVQIFHNGQCPIEHPEYAFLWSHDQRVDHILSLLPTE